MACVALFVGIITILVDNTQQIYVKNTISKYVKHCFFKQMSALSVL